MKRLPLLAILALVVLAALVLSERQTLPPQTAEAAPTPSGAKPLYPANFNFDAAGQGEVGVPPSNHDFEIDARQVGTPPTNYDFETGDLTGWTTSGTVSVESGGPSGYYAKLGSGGNIISSPFTIPNEAQSLRLDVGMLGSGTNWYYVYILSGPDYGTQTRVKYEYCSSCQGEWKTVEVDPADWRGESVKIKVRRYYGTIGADNVGVPYEVLVDWASQGLIAQGTGGPSGKYAKITKDITSQAFTVDESAQVMALQAALLASGYNTFRVWVLSGQDYSTETEVFTKSSSSSLDWAEYKFGMADWAGQSIKLKIDWYQGEIGIDDAGVATEVVKEWSPSGNGSFEVGSDPEVGSYIGIDAKGSIELTSQTVGNPFSYTRFSITYRLHENWYPNGINYGSGFRVWWVSGQGEWVIYQNGSYEETGWVQDETLTVWPFMGTSGTFKITRIIGPFEVAEIGGNQADFHSYPPPAPPSPEPSPPPENTPDPVAVASGAYHHQHTDLYIPGKGIPLEFTRHYNAHSTYVGSLGHRWVHNYAMEVDERSGNDAEVRYPSGRLVRFNYDNGSYIPPAGIFDTLVKNGDDTWTLTTKRQVRYNFDTSGNLASIVDRNDNTTTLAYTSGRLTSVTDPGGRSLTFSYDGSGRVTQVTDPLNRTVQYAYDSNGDLVTVTNVLGGQSTFTYSNHRLVTGTDARGNTFVTNVYDGANRVVQQTDAMDNVTTIAYDTPGEGATRMTDARSNSTTFYFDQEYRVTDIEDALEGVATWIYDDDKNITSVTDQNNHTTSFTYDDAGNVLTTTNALSKTWTFTYNSNNDLLTVTDPLSRETDFAYDASGNLTSITNALQQEVTIGRDGSGQITAITSPLEHTTTFGYDTYGNLTNVTDPLQESATMAYDLGGRMTSFTDQRNKTTTYTYDAVNGLLTLTDPLSHVTTFVYDAKGNLTSATDANEKVTSFAYDALDRLTTVTDALEQATTYGYDALGNLTSVLNARDKTTSYAYDALSRLTQETDPLERSRTYVYDAASRLTSRTNAEEETTTYSYDDANRLTTVTYPVGSVTLTYDDVGNPLTMVDSTGTTTHTYDDLNRILSATSPGPNTVSYTYDSDGNLDTMTYPGSKVVAYSHDAVGQLASVTDWLEKTTSYTYDDAGNVLSASYPNGVTATYTYDDASRLTSVVNSQGENTLSSYTYTLGAVGNRTQMVDLSGTHSYQYDDLYRLTQATYPDQSTISYTYDAVGNRLTENDTSYTYDDADQMTEAGGTSYTYDANGNQTGRGNDSFSYDYESRLTQATVGGTTSSFTYNGAGQRVSKTVGANTTDYVWSNSGSLPLVLYDGNYYVYGLGLIARTDSQDSQLYYLADGLGSTTGLTDGEGSVVGTYTYDVFGAIRSETGGQTNDYRFTGQQLDVASDLYYLRARYYDPAIGRFMAMDPFLGFWGSPLSLNQYLYALDDPVNLIDPFGLFGFKDIKNAAGKVGGGIKKGAEKAGSPIKTGLERGADVTDWTRGGILRGADWTRDQTLRASDWAYENAISPVIDFLGGCEGKLLAGGAAMVVVGAGTVGLGGVAVGIAAEAAIEGGIIMGGGFTLSAFGGLAIADACLGTESRFSLSDRYQRLSDEDKR
jgi:RHS repeat-associated protein